MIVKAEKIVPGGSALCHSEDGKVVLVDSLFPGESALVAVTDTKKDYTKARILEITQQSPFRRKSVCPYSKICGGCNLIELSYKEQLDSKIGFIKDLDICSNILSPEYSEDNEFGYRSRARFEYSICNNVPVLGFRQSSSNEFVPLKSCPVCDSAINSFIKNPPRLNLWELKDRNLPCISTDTGVISDDSIGWITINNRRLPVSNSVFFQSNLILLPKLIDYIVSNIEGSTVMDLYSGIGTFSAFLEDKYDVTAVEINKNCLDIAKKHLKKTSFFTSPVEKWKPSIHSVDTVIVDPPRTGLDSKVPSMIASWNPLRIIYVSCFLPTLARDIKRFASLGYKADSIKLFDFYPQTSHCESVVLLNNLNLRSKNYITIDLDMDEYRRIKDSQKQ